ncbi:BolA family protein [Cardiosporidium cionae]|uniref:BolA family protein n=1 Tax=Cardiosporidium cionae TaxID=476202 RepID=A0ABQ7JE50_9APIC|nr:BolA family protein [Cardiosporidium cionae]|eukprot:KAF8822180.1 BolA family protein [Cardiosporidium cionae]
MKCWRRYFAANWYEVVRKIKFSAFKGQFLLFLGCLFCCHSFAFQIPLSYRYIQRPQRSHTFGATAISDDSISATEMRPVYNTIVHKLSVALKPTRLNVIDESHQHATHQEVKLNPWKYASGESHFRVEVESELFKGLPVLQRHKMIYELLDDELKNSVHALSISAKVPMD